MQDIDGMMWFGTKDGFCKYDAGQITVYQPNTPGPTSIASNDVRAMCEDKFDTRANRLPGEPVTTGTMWIGVFGEGLYKFDKTRGALTQYRHDPGDPASLSDDRVLSIYEDRGGVLWIGTVDGLNSFDKKTGFFAHFRHEPDNPNSLSEDRVWPVCEDRMGSLWIGTVGGGLDRLDKNTGEFRHYRRDVTSPKSLASNTVVCLYRDRAGTMWVGMENGGLDEFVEEMDGFNHYLPGESVFSIHEDNYGKLYVGTFGDGLKILDRKTGKFSSVKHDPTYKKSLGDNRVRSTFVDRAGNVWLGTDGGGVNVFTPDAGKK
jgi:ligand-binding sensor domain-containing protein